MHKFLRAIGFSEFTKKSQIEEFFAENLANKNLVSTYQTSDGRLCGQYNIEVLPGAGISVVGEQEGKDLSLINFYYPYSKGYDYTLIEECTIERHSDKESFAGIIDDYRMGMALIFYLTNGNIYSSLINSHKLQDIKIDKIFLSALSVSGRIILPIEKKPVKSNVNIVEDIEDFDDDDDDISESGVKAISIGIGIKLPKEPAGDQEARLKNEDLYSIVETSFVPSGIESDKYQIVANILSVNKKTNVFTHEVVYDMRVDTMGLQFNVLINEKDLDGEPAPNRRFRGVVWLLGEVEFLTKVKSKQ